MASHSVVDPTKKRLRCRLIRGCYYLGLESYTVIKASALDHYGDACGGASVEILRMVYFRYLAYAH